MIKLGSNPKETSLMSMPKAIRDYIDDIVKPLEASEGPIEDYSSDIGGDFYLCETVEDLKLITVCTINPATGAWYTLYDKADSFDSAMKVGVYIMLFLASNNAGGDVYFVPPDVYEKAPNVEDSIKLTEKFWSMEQ